MRIFPSFLPLVVAGLTMTLHLPRANAEALSLDGSGDYVTFDGEGLPKDNDSFTLEAWINPTSIPAGGASGGQITFWGNQTSDQSNGLRLRGGSGVRHFFWGNDHDENFGIDILPDTTGENGWHHLAFSYNGSESRWYWNGAPLGSARASSDVNVANANHRIGSRLNAEYFHGFIDEVRIWNKARSAAEIAADYDQELAGNEPNLVAYFNFESGYADAAGGDNDGTPVGNATIAAATNAPIQTSGPVITTFAANPPIALEGQSATLSWEIDDSNVVGALLVEILDSGAAVVHSASTSTGNFAVAVGDTGGSTQLLTYTLRASESGGEMISRETTADLQADPGKPVAAPQSLQVAGSAPLNITLTGIDPNAHPNPGVTFTLLSNPAGNLTGTPPNLTYTADPGNPGADSFDFRVNDGKYDSPPATVTILVTAPPVPPTDIGIGTTTIGQGVVDGGFIGAFSSTDANGGDTHTYALVAGSGDDDNALFNIVGNQLRAAVSFAGQLGNDLSIRLRSTDSSGLTVEKVFVLTVIEVSNSIVINEIHYNPSDNTVRQEFIELYNPAAVEADISGWRLSGAVSYIFPPATRIPPDGYLVIGEDPPTLASTFGITAIGPFNGKLDSDGETVRLRNQNDTIVDLVDYRSSFPWPVAGDAGGASIELINPALDNSLGSSWRASLPENAIGGTTFLNFDDSGWSWRAGETEASAPLDAWRANGFIEDASWNKNKPGPLGYGSVGAYTSNTVIDTMRGNYTTLFLRNTFTVAPGELPSQVVLTYLADDGCIIWINGVEVERKRFDPAEIPTIDDTGDNVSPEGLLETKTLTNPGTIFVDGINTVAVQVFNQQADSSDLLFDLKIGPPGSDQVEPAPTPGGPNLVLATNAAPNIRKVNHTPEQPTNSDQVIITALVTDPDGVALVEVEYQVVRPGRYLPARLPYDAPNIPVQNELQDNPNYDLPGNWSTVTMVDDGSGDDALAGDDIYTATLPGQGHRTLVRYRITIEDSQGLSERVPYADDPSLNFAYFVYNGVPAYNGHSIETMNTLPVYHLITRNEDWDECIAYDGGNQISQGGPNLARFYYNWTGTLVYDGEVYDNIRYRLRGANGRYHARGKRSMRFRLNKGRYFQARDQFGKKYPRKLRTLTTGKCFGNKQNLSYALNEAVSMYLYNKVGVPGCNTHWVQWRVIDDGREAPDQWHGDFHGIYFILETYDVRFLESHKLEKGNLYKLINSTRSADRQQRYQSAFGAVAGRDHDWIENTLDGNTAPETVRAHVNLEKWNLNHAMVEAIKHYDYWPSANKNMVYYFEPDYLPQNRNYGKLWILPWDTDATWGPTYNSGHDVVYNALFPAGGGGADGASNPELWPDYFNTVREIRDLLWQPDQIDGVLEEFASYIQPLEQADRDRWQGAPSTSGNYGGLVGAGLTSLDALVQDMHNFAFVGGSWPGGSVGAGGRAAHLDSRQGQNGEGGLIPNTPRLRYVGDSGFPTNGVVFGTTAFGDPQGSGTFGAMEYRVAEITDPTAPGYDPADRFKLEWETAWESGLLTVFTPSVTIPTAALRSGRTYRARVRHQDNSGRWSHWSAPIEFTTTLPDISDFLNGLVISEFMYHPTDPTAAEFAAGFTKEGDFEWIELRNVGPVPLDLTDLRFTKGIDFDFLGADITSLNPGAFVLIVSHRAAFEMRYGAGLPVAGEWDAGDRLDNGGEQLKLSFGGGDSIRDFIYSDLPPWPGDPDGSGTTLTLIDPESLPDHTLASSWRGSFATQGTPGVGETTGGFASWLLDQGAVDPLAPYQNSSLSNLLAYSVGADFVAAPADALPFPTLVEDGGELYGALNYRVRLGTSDLTYLVEVSQDLLNWESGPTFMVAVGLPQDNGDGTATVTVRSLKRLLDFPRQFLRLRATALP